MKILHAYCLNHNLGDYYLGIGVKNILRHYLQVELIAETNLQGTVFNEYYIKNVVNKKYDLLVIGGGGIIHGAHWPNGWFWLIDQELIQQIKIPFIVYGAGYNYFANEPGIPEVGKAHLAETIHRAAHFSVRNDGSHERLKSQLGISVPVVPDPGFHINLDRSYSCPETDRFVIVQLANDKPEHRFQDKQTAQNFIDSLRRSLSSISQKFKIIFAPHVHEDLALSEQVAEGMENAYVWDFSKFAFDRAQESIGYYMKAEFVIAMRGHGQIIPFAFNTPVISLENHPKHSGLMNELGLSDYNILAADNHLMSNLNERISRIEANQVVYRDHLRTRNQAMLEQTGAALAEIIRKLS